MSVKKTFKVKHFYFLVRSWNAFEWFDKCIDSILIQKNKNFTILFVDDASDYTTNQKKYIRKKLTNHIVVFNKTRQYSLKNAYDMIHRYAKQKNSVIVNVDGDDWLIRDDVLDILKKEYDTHNCALTYGNCEYYAPGTEKHGEKGSDFAEINHRYPDHIERNKSYRKYFFLPLHLRTWKTEAFKQIPKHNFLRPDGSWIQFCEDQAIFYPLLESREKYSVLSEILCSYNIAHQKNDFPHNKNQLLKDELCIRKKRN